VDRGYPTPLPPIKRGRIDTKGFKCREEESSADDYTGSYSLTEQIEDRKWQASLAIFVYFFIDLPS